MDVASGIKSPLTKSRVVVVKDDSAFSNYRIDQNVVQIMVDAGIRTLTGINDVGEAWKSLSPDFYFLPIAILSFYY